MAGSFQSERTLDGDEEGESRDRTFDEVKAPLVSPNSLKKNQNQYMRTDSLGVSEPVGIPRETSSSKIT